VGRHPATERKETDALKRKALQHRIEIQRNASWWWAGAENFGGSVETWELVRDEFEYLTETGKAGTRKLIREERRRLQEQERRDVEWLRQGTQWKLTIAGVIVGWILGALGILIGLFALLKK